MSFRIIAKWTGQIPAEVMVQSVSDGEPGTIIVRANAERRDRYVLEVPCPRRQGSLADEEAALTACCTACLERAAALGCQSIAFPLMAPEELPKDRALQAVLAAVRAYLQEHEMNVYLAMPDRTAFVLPGDFLREVRKALADILAAGPDRFGMSAKQCAMAPDPYVRPEPDLEEARAFGADEAPGCPTMVDGGYGTVSEEYPELVHRLQQRTESFQECLLRMIDERGLTDAEVYKRANLDRKHFSKIRCNRDYRPTKRTAVALALGLHLDLEQTNLLLGRAGMVLTESSRFDTIVKFFIEKGIYDIPFCINHVLYENREDTLGA